MPVPPTAASAQIREPDVAIIGGGAGGLSAAIAARKAGANVLVMDERKVAGGQYYKQSANHPPLDAQQAEGATLLQNAQASGAEIMGAVEIWGAFDGPLFLADVGGAALVVRPKTAIIATRCLRTASNGAGLDFARGDDHRRGADLVAQLSNHSWKTRGSLRIRAIECASRAGTCAG